LTESDTPLETEVDLDVKAYEEFQHLDKDHHLALECTYIAYTDSEWRQNSVVLDGDPNRITGLHLGPTQRFRQNKQPPRFFFDLWWDDVALAELVKQKNLYS